MEYFRLYSVSMPGRCRKVMAAFVLIWALADLTVPGLCQADDNKIVPGDSVTFMGSQAKQVSSVWPAEGSPLPDQDSPDECFCCSPYACPTSVHSAHTCFDVCWTLDAPVAETPIAAALVVNITEPLFQQARDSLADSLHPIALPLRC
jgi:hypothetical protein